MSHDWSQTSAYRSISAVLGSGSSPLVLPLGNQCMNKIA